MPEQFENSHSHPAVTVVIPTYNHAQFLKKALSSVISQTFTDWEAIVVNNFSEDNTIEIVTSFSDERIKLLNFHNNGSIAASRNQGIKLGRGRYVAFLDSDDFWFPEKLKTALAIMEETGCDLVCNGESLIENDKVIATWHHGPQHRATLPQLILNGNCFSTSAVTVKKDQLLKAGLFREDKNLNTSEDYDLWIRLVKQGCKTKFMGIVLGGHLKHAANNSGAAIRHLNSAIAVVESHISDIKNPVVAYIIKKLSYANMYYGAARQLARQNNFTEAISYFQKSLVKNPFRVKTYLAILILGVQFLKKASA